MANREDEIRLRRYLEATEEEENEENDTRRSSSRERALIHWHLQGRGFRSGGTETNMNFFGQRPSENQPPLHLMRYDNSQVRSGWNRNQSEERHPQIERNQVSFGRFHGHSQSHVCHICRSYGHPYRSSHSHLRNTPVNSDRPHHDRSVRPHHAHSDGRRHDLSGRPHHNHSDRHYRDRSGRPHHDHSGRFHPGYTGRAHPSHSGIAHEGHAERAHLRHVELAHRGHRGSAHLNHTGLAPHNHAERAHLRHVELVHHGHRGRAHLNHTGLAPHNHAERAHLRHMELAHHGHRGRAHLNHTGLAPHNRAERAHLRHMELAHRGHRERAHLNHTGLAPHNRAESAHLGHMELAHRHHRGRAHLNHTGLAPHNHARRANHDCSGRAHNNRTWRSRSREERDGGQTGRFERIQTSSDSDSEIDRFSTIREMTDYLWDQDQQRNELINFNRGMIEEGDRSSVESDESSDSLWRYEVDTEFLNGRFTSIRTIPRRPKGVRLNFNIGAWTNRTNLSLHTRFTILRNLRHTRMNYMNHRLRRREN